MTIAKLILLLATEILAVTAVDDCPSQNTTAKTAVILQQNLLLLLG